ncbi:hypothetical protein ACI0X9_002441 [Cronobacter turicensis]|uniref:hypothetical protein n=1 Tax=Cronobacter turicensis TaxID=413502 RepID=UPI0020CA593E|nr:hypothetical protein [Cronobacter turicensis]
MITSRKYIFCELYTETSALKYLRADAPLLRIAALSGCNTAFHLSNPLAGGSIKRRNGFLGMISCRVSRRFTAVYPDFQGLRRCGAKAAILNIGIM